MLNEIFGRVPCNPFFKKDDVVYIKSMIQQSNEKLAPFKCYNHATLGHISGFIKIDKKLKKYFVNDDSLSGIKLKRFTDSYRTAVEKWRSKIPDETRRTILGSLGVKKNKQWTIGIIKFHHLLGNCILWKPPNNQYSRWTLLLSLSFILFLYLYQRSLVSFWSHLIDFHKWRGGVVTYKLSFRDSCGIKAGTTNAAESMLWNSTTLNSVVSLQKVSPLAKNIHLWIFISVELFKEQIHAKRMVVELEKITFPQRSSFAETV